MATDDKLSELVKLARKATPGEWSTWADCLVIAPGPPGVPMVADCKSRPAADAAYIAACDPDTVIALVEEIERLKRDYEHARHVANAYYDRLVALGEEDYV